MNTFHSRMFFFPLFSRLYGESPADKPSVGPRKLAKVFALALKRHATLSESLPQGSQLSLQPSIQVDSSPQQDLSNQAKNLNVGSPSTIPPTATIQPPFPDSTVRDEATLTPSQPKKRSTFLLVDDNAINLKVSMFRTCAIHSFDDFFFWLSRCWSHI